MVILHKKASVPLLVEIHLCRLIFLVVIDLERFASQIGKVFVRIFHSQRFSFRNKLFVSLNVIHKFFAGMLAQIVIQSTFVAAVSRHVDPVQFALEIQQFGSKPQCIGVKAPGFVSCLVRVAVINNIYFSSFAEKRHKIIIDFIMICYGSPFRLGSQPVPDSSKSDHRNPRNRCFSCFLFAFHQNQRQL